MPETGPRQKLRPYLKNSLKEKRRFGSSGRLIANAEP
jgi:hypothetical protein